MKAKGKQNTMLRSCDVDEVLIGNIEGNEMC
jgi:hypothetical protein